jgi:hypothetical protein
MRAIAVTTIADQSAPGIKKLFKLAEICSSELVIIGDKKTPAWDVRKLPTFVHYFSVEDQIKKWPTLASLLPYNHYARKNLAYLWAMENGVSVLLDTDDDNSSEIDVFVVSEKKYRVIESDVEWVNVYAYFEGKGIWPRGLPLDEAMKPISPAEEMQGELEWSCFQSIVDGDPDLDAIGRMLYPENHFFAEKSPLLLTKMNFCPTNSQATLWKEPLLPLLYLPVTSSFRMTDIWRGIILSGFTREANLNTAFGKLGFQQDRNVHNLISDFLDEVSGHVSNRLIKKLSDDIWRLTPNIMENWESALTAIYEELQAEGLVESLEVDCLSEFTKLSQSYLN